MRIDDNVQTLTDEVIANRKAAKQLAWDQALRGDPICGGLFALESMAQAAGLGYEATTMQDWRDEDEDDEIRPF